MQSENTESGRSGRRESSDDLRIEIHLFACGHGDTILVRLPGERWVLVDCHLPDRARQERFFAFVEENRIRRLDFIFQTHPDFDHYCGMVEVLEYFTQDGRSVGYWCDGGLDAEQVRHLIWEEEFSEREYRRLHDKLDELSLGGLIQTVAVNDWTQPISPKGYANRVDLHVLAPSGTLARQVSRQNVGSLSGDIRAKLEKNALSLVLALRVTADEATYNAILCGDASPEEIRWAINQWGERTRTDKNASGFDVVKVPHHGSKGSHADELCELTRTDRDTRVAAISAGSRRALPDREVIHAYLNKQWTVLLTK